MGNSRLLAVLLAAAGSALVAIPVLTAGDDEEALANLTIVLGVGFDIAVLIVVLIAVAYLVRWLWHRGLPRIVRAVRDWWRAGAEPTEGP